MRLFLVRGGQLVEFAYVSGLRLGFDGTGRPAWGEYFRLSRFLQPSLMVIKDVDLIARERTHMHAPGEEILLNRLLNEMDGLQEDAEVLLILTTNRPEQIEPALGSRPGRIDQAVEFPLPDEEGRTKLAKLSAGRRA